MNGARGETNLYQRNLLGEVCACSLMDLLCTFLYMGERSRSLKLVDRFISWASDRSSATFFQNMATCYLYLRQMFLIPTIFSSAFPKYSNKPTLAFLDLQKSWSASLERPKIEAAFGENPSHGPWVIQHSGMNSQKAANLLFLEV